MNPTWPEINNFYLLIAVVGIPLLVGFFTEAGKDLYNTVRKKPSSDQFLEKCKEARNECISRMKEEITGLKKQDELMSIKQSDFRENKLPDIERKLSKIETNTQGTKDQLDKLNKTVCDFFDKWDEATMNKIFGTHTGQ